MKYHRTILGCQLLDPRERQVDRARNALPHMLIGIAYINQPRALGDQPLRLWRAQCGNGHGLVLLAIKLIKRAKQRLGARVGNAIPKRLALAAEGDESLIAHLSKVLR